MLSSLSTNPAARRLAISEDSLWAGALLAVAGGFLDAFTYLGHGHVFANGMTANVVLLGVSASTGNWSQSAHYFPPIFAFLGGVAVAQALKLPRIRVYLPIHDSAVAALTLEILFLFFAGWLPESFPDLPLVLSISFLGAVQTTTFQRVGPWSYTSTMTTGNLRQLGESSFQAFISHRNSESKQKAKTYAIICISFLMGALGGGFCVESLQNRSLWIAAFLLLLVWGALLNKSRAS